MAYEMVMPYHLHMPSYFLETFTEYPILDNNKKKDMIKIISFFLYYKIINLCSLW